MMVDYSISITDLCSQLCTLFKKHLAGCPCRSYFLDNISREIGSVGPATWKTTWFVRFMRIRKPRNGVGFTIRISKGPWIAGHYSALVIPGKGDFKRIRRKFLCIWLD